MMIEYRIFGSRSSIATHPYWYLFTIYKNSQPLCGILHDCGAFILSLDNSQDFSLVYY